jgi:hypothetical protein
METIRDAAAVDWTVVDIREFLQLKFPFIFNLNLFKGIPLNK